MRRIHSIFWRVAAIGFGAAGLIVATLGLAPAATATAPPQYIHLRVTQAHDSSGRTIVSVWMDTNGGMLTSTYFPVGYPLVYVQASQTTCQADPIQPLPGGKTQLIYLPTLNIDFNPIRWQPVVRIPTTRAGHITICGYLVSWQDVAYPFTVFTSATTSVSVAVQPPRGRTSMPVNQGPWRSCATRDTPQVVRLLANRGVAGGCATATTIANTWVNQWRANEGWEEGEAWTNVAFSYPAVKWTSSPISALHRTLACQETALPPARFDQQEDVNCGLATFKFNPGL